MIFSGLELAAPLLVAALGALISERAGVLNIALEGYWILGAFLGILLVQLPGGWALGLVVLVLVGGALGLGQGILALKLQADPFILGLGLNLLLAALVGLVSQGLFGTAGQIRWDNFSGVGTLGGLGVLVPLALVLVPLVWAFLDRSPWGWSLRTAGSRPDLLKQTGQNPQSYQLQALGLSGALGTLAGGIFVLNLGAFNPGMTTGRGWISLVILYLGLRSPWGTALAAGVYATAEIAARNLQALPEIPQGFLSAFPFLLTLAAYVIYSGLRFRKGQRP